MEQQVTRYDIAVHTIGEVLDSAREYVQKQVAAFLRRVPDTVASARVKLTAFTRSNAPWPALAQANLTVAGRPIRAQVAATFFPEAGRLLRTRLKEQAARLAHPMEDHLVPIFVANGAAGDGPVSLCHHETEAAGGLTVSSFRFD